MSAPRQFDVIVVGAGLIGAAAACLFARQGLTVALVEARALDRHAGAAEETDKRVSAINLAAFGLFDALGVWRGIDPQRVSRYDAMKVWDCNSPAKISFLAADLGAPCLGYIVENRALVAALREKLRQNYNVTLLDNTEVAGINYDPNPDDADCRLSVTLSDSGERVQTRLLVGADGARSGVRELGGLHSRSEDFGQDAITATVSTARNHRATAWQCFLETGPVAMLPLADGRCSLVWSCDRAEADELMRLEDADFCARLQPLFAHELGDITACQPRRRFALRQQHADAYIAEAVALIGDAAHTTHPLAGLGANIGLVDAAALAEVVEWARRHRKDIGQTSVLRRYERWRRGDNARVLAMMKGFKEIFGSRHAGAKAVRSAGMNLADTVTPLKMVLAKFATGQYGDLPALCRRT